MNSTAVVILLSACVSAQAAEPARGPLRVHPANGRYFTADGVRAVLLTGSHTWGNFQEYRPHDDLSGRFDWSGYLEFLLKHGHNFIRLWTWENWFADGGPNQINNHWSDPLPYARTGPGSAIDGKPKFDVSRFHQPYFDRLRSRVIAAGDRGLYVSIMLFQGWSVRKFQKGRRVFRYHPFHPANNANGIDGDPNGSGEGEEVHTLAINAVTRAQEAYVRKVVDTVNDLDNVLYEVSNESLLPATRDWQYHIIRYVKQCEAGKPRQHPVGMTGHTGLDNSVLLDSPADWVSPGTTRYPNRTNEMVIDPPAADGRKVLVHDTDHLGALSFVEDAAFARNWVWKSFTRGYNPILMELDVTNPMADARAGLAAARGAMGSIRKLAETVDLESMIPRDGLASSKYCLANPGKEYVAYLPEGKELRIDLTAAASSGFEVAWMDPISGAMVPAGAVAGGAIRSLTSPFEGGVARVRVARAPAPWFTPPAGFAGEFGAYRSPLKFYDGRPVRNAADWANRRKEILERWHRLMGPWPPLIDRPLIEYLARARRENFTQHRVRVEVAPGNRTTEGYLAVPDGRGPFPAVVVVYYDPETSVGLGKEQRDFAYQLTRRGFVTLSIGTPECRYYPSERDVAVQPLSMLAYVAANLHSALARLPQVDREHIGIMGHSYGGKWAMFASCLYDRFAASAWSDPGIVFDETRANVNYWEPWYLGWERGVTRKRGIPTPDNPRTGSYRRMMAEGYDLHELHALMAPRPFLVSGGAEDRPERWKALNHAIAVNRLLGYSDRVGMTNRAAHAPTPESNEQIYAFFTSVLRKP